MFSSIWAWLNGWVNNREAGDLRRHRAHYDVIVMTAVNWVIMGSDDSLPSTWCLEKYKQCSSIIAHWFIKFNSLCLTVNTNQNIKDMFLIFTRGQFWPSGIVVACVCVCVCVCLSVCLCVNHLLVRTITRDLFKLGSPNLDQRCKRPWLRSLLFWGAIDLDLQGQI